MSSPNALPPERGRLEAVLSAMLDDRRLAVIDRRRWAQGTFPKEVVRCRLSSGETIALFCKYSPEPRSNGAGRHRRGVAHEARVYRDLLRPMGVSAPPVRGVLEDGGKGEIWLVLEYLEGGMRLAKAPDPGAMQAAAGWIASFHAASERGPGIPPAGFLATYDDDYYMGWARRTYRRCAVLPEGERPWLEPLCRGFPRAIEALRTAPQVIIHGEYYPKNILFRDGTIYPVDWESTAIGPGEIDLASLTEAWPEETVEACVAHYREARRATACSYDFEHTLGAARLYLLFRWLGDPSQPPPDRGRLEQLRALGERLGLV